MRNVQIQPLAWQHFEFWLTENPKTLTKIFGLIKSAATTPFEGIGKPEPLKANYKGYWSRRITQEHRLVYKAEPDSIIIISAKGHY